MIPEEIRKAFIEKAREQGEAQAKAQLAELEFSRIRDQLYVDFNDGDPDFEKAKAEIIGSQEASADSFKMDKDGGISAKTDLSVERKVEDTKESKESEEEEKVVLIDIQNPPEDLPSSSKSITIDDAIEWMDKMPESDRKEWAEGDTRLGILRYLGYSEEEIEDIRSKDDEPDESENEDSQEESSEEDSQEETKSSGVPSPPPPPAPPKPPSKPKEAESPSEPNKPEEKKEEPEVPETKDNPKNNDSKRVELPEGVVRPEGSPECFGNENVYDPESKVCLTCIYDYECQEAIEAKSDA